MNKKLIIQTLTLLVFIFFSINSYSQNGLNFQGVARTSNNIILASQSISIRLSILRENTDGTKFEEYVETRKVFTNAQGLFTAVIGDTGAISRLGNFANINWKLSPKFLKIEMDPAGGNNFINMGTTQFQYVAYAQFAKSVDAENIVGIVPVTLGGTGVNSLAGLKTALTLNNVNNTADLNKPISTLTQTALDLKLNAADTSKYAKQTYTDSALVAKQVLIGSKLNAADTSKYTKQTYTDSALLTKLNITGNATTATTAGNITATSNTTLNSLSNLATVGTITSGIWSGTTLSIDKGGTGLTQTGTIGQVLTSTGAGTLTWTGTHYIGEYYGGGIVFYVYDGGKHGLIASTADATTPDIFGRVRWFGGSNTITRARADGVGAGLKNTAIIIANQGAVDGNPFAASICNEYFVTEIKNGITTIYNDWYLPSSIEFKLMTQSGVPLNLIGPRYWTSTEVNGEYAAMKAYIFNVWYDSLALKGEVHSIRPIRAF